LSWAQGLENGGTPVVDFNLVYNEVGNSQTVTVSAITSQTYRVIGLT
jgi:hypothetical protein